MTLQEIITPKGLSPRESPRLDVSVEGGTGVKNDELPRRFLYIPLVLFSLQRKGQ
jgi:hypothetical protein